MKTMISMAGILFAGFLAGVADAQRPGMGKGMGPGAGMHRMMSDSACPMGGMLMQGMMGRSMVATEDGGVVVMMGNQLYKYDKNLALKKEVEVKVDTAKMRAAMMGVMKACPMMDMPGDTSTARPRGATGSVKPETPTPDAKPAPQGKQPAKTANRPRADDP